MSEISDRYDRIADGFETVMSRVGDRWDSPSPCEGWTARDVVRHLVDVHRMILARLDGSEPTLLADEDDATAEWPKARADVLARLTDEKQASTIVGGAFGEQPWEKLASGVLCTDTLLHTWDLATATGQQVQLDDGAITASLEFLTPFDQALRRPGGFGPKVDAPGDADLQTQLVAFSGRRP